MKKHIVYLSFLLGLTFSLTAAAQDAPETAAQITVPRIETKEDLCRELTKYKPDQGVAYQQGVDVYGDPVVPADLERPINFEVLDPIQIPIEIDVLENMQIVNQVRGLNLDTNVSEILVYTDGRVEYNGQKIEDRVIAACAGKPRPADQKSASGGQAAPDTVKSGLEQSGKPAGSDAIDGQYPPEQ
jgi:hypothetical protein